MDGTVSLFSTADYKCITHSERDKAEMKEHANQHIMDSINSIREIWDASDPDVKQQIRTDLANMISAMN